MFLFVGLGNPDESFTSHKHNAGFHVLDLFTSLVGGEFKVDLKLNSDVAEVNLEGNKAILLKPRTWMNSSGVAVRAALLARDIPTSNLVVIYDDIAFAPGVIGMRSGGSSGNHNGVKSVIEKVGTGDFTRIRVGVGARPKEITLSEWVLSDFSGEAIPEYLDAITNAVEVIRSLILGKRLDLLTREINALRRKNCAN